MHPLTDKVLLDARRDCISFLLNHFLYLFEVELPPTCSLMGLDADCGHDLRGKGTRGIAFHLVNDKLLVPPREAVDVIFCHSQLLCALLVRISRVHNLNRPGRGNGLVGVLLVIVLAIIVVGRKRLIVVG